MTDAELQLLSDIRRNLFDEKGMRWSVSYIAKSSNKANNNYIESYNEYLNENNLYSWAISQYLFYGGFEWLSQKQIDTFDVNVVEKICMDT